MNSLISNNHLADPARNNSQSDGWSFSRGITMAWLAGMMAMSPVKIFHFPLNMELMDFWILIPLPFFLLFFVAKQQTMISWAYVPIMLAILAVSFFSSFAALNPSKSLIVIGKEIYLFIWFLTVTVLLCGLSTMDLRRVMVIWSGVAVLHGLLIIAQFLSPAIWQFTKSISGNTELYDHYRSPGLFPNANAAAFSQLMGFVPLVLANYSKPLAIILGICLFFSLLATGSMGAIIGSVAGLSIAIFIILVVGRNLAAITRYFIPSIITIFFLGGVLLVGISQNESYQSRLENIVFGRAERSSGGRFDLWQRGTEVFLEYSGVFWGVGPENFREIDGRDKQLHNDFLAFAVERGLLAAVALVVFGAIAVSRAIHLFRIGQARAGLKVVIFLSAIMAMLVESLTHQIFHYRELWLVLALQEAMIFKMTFEQERQIDVKRTEAAHYPFG